MCFLLPLEDFLIYKCCNVYKYIVVNSGMVFVCPIITQEPLDRFASNFDWKTRKNHGNLPSGSGKMAKIVIYDQARVNGSGNYTLHLTLKMNPI